MVELVKFSLALVETDVHWRRYYKLKELHRGNPVMASQNVVCFILQVLQNLSRDLFAKILIYNHGMYLRQIPQKVRATSAKMN